MKIKTLAQCLKAAGCSAPIAEWIERVSERTLDLLFIIDHDGIIRFASPMHSKTWEALILPGSRCQPYSLLGTDYFGLFRVKPTDKRITTIPLWRAMHGKPVATKPPYPIIGMWNKKTYVIETLPARTNPNIYLEMWRLSGHPSVFKTHEMFLDFRRPSR